MIKGIGLDLVEISRIKCIKTLDSFVNRILSEKEIVIFNSYNNLERKYQFLAGRFSAKEAYAKALGTGIGHLSFKEIEILNDELGKPYIKNGDYLIHISITHTENYAAAQVIIEYKNK